MIRIFKHYIPKSHLLLAFVETCVFFIAIYLGAFIRFSGSLTSLPEGVGPLFPKALVFVFIMMAGQVGVGLYQRHLRDGPKGLALRLAVSFTAGFVVMSLIFYIIPQMHLGRGLFGIAFAAALISIILIRIFHVKLIDHEILQRRILIVGAGEKASLVDQCLKRRTDRRGFVVVGYLPLPGEDVLVDESQCIPYDESLINIVEEQDISEIVVAITDRRNAFPAEEILDCKMSGIDVVDLLTFMERQTGRVLLDLLQPSWLIFSDGFQQGPSKMFAKRVFDVSASLFLLMFALPIMLVTAVLIFLDDRGPVFYRQVRVGQNWKLVQIMKFRSMRVDAEKDGAQFAKKDDDRVTRIGGFIRRTRIDELPQLFNVLRGDMSFVGPRPERPEFVEQFSKNIAYYAERHRVKPGITGWAQISYPYGASEKDTIEKFQYDLYYVKNYSLFLDLSILLQTAEVVLWGKGAR